MFFFRPTGWDNDKKVAILYENLQNMKPEDAFNDVIVKPTTRKVNFCDFSKAAFWDNTVHINC